MTGTPPSYSDTATYSAPEVTPAANNRRGSRRGWLLLALIALLMGMGAGGWLAYVYGPRRVVTDGRRTESPRPAAAQADMTRPDMTTPATAPGNSAAGAPATTGTTGVEAALSQRLAELEARLARLNVAAQAAGGNATRAEDLLVAFAARRAVERGLAMGYLESELQQRFGKTMPKAVASIVEESRYPVTADRLSEQLDLLEPQLVVPEGAGVWPRIRYEVANLFVFRSAKTVYLDPSQRMNRARRALDIGRVDRAITEVEALPGALRAQNWLAAARRYVEAQRALDLIEYAAIQGASGVVGMPTLPPASAGMPAAASVALPSAANAPVAEVADMAPTPVQTPAPAPVNSGAPSPSAQQTR